MRTTRILAAAALGGSVAFVGAGLPGTPAGAETTSFPAGEATEFEVPAGVTCIEFTLEGAAGGAGGDWELLFLDASAAGDPTSTGGDGGAGGKAVATLIVEPGEVLLVTVGTEGGTPASSSPEVEPEADDAAPAGDEIPVDEPGAGGFNGGADGGVGEGAEGGGGGGATDVRQGGTGPADRVLVAGGGGGGGAGGPEDDEIETGSAGTASAAPSGLAPLQGGGAGGAGGGASGSPGEDGFVAPNDAVAEGGGGGTATAPGAGGDGVHEDDVTPVGNVSEDGSDGDGPDGGLGGTSGDGGGGGGGGWFGGGGGGAGYATTGAGGGGGSGHGPADTVYSAGPASGDGSATATYTPGDTSCTDVDAGGEEAPPAEPAEEAPNFTG